MATGRTDTSLANTKRFEKGLQYITYGIFAALQYQLSPLPSLPIVIIQSANRLPTSVKVVCPPVPL